MATIVASCGPNFNRILTISLSFIFTIASQNKNSGMHGVQAGKLLYTIIQKLYKCHNTYIVTLDIKLVYIMLQNLPIMLFSIADDFCGLQ